MITWDDLVIKYNDKFYFDLEDDKFMSVYNMRNDEFVVKISYDNIVPSFIHKELDKYLVNRRNTLIGNII